MKIEFIYYYYYYYYNENQPSSIEKDCVRYDGDYVITSYDCA